MATPKRSDPQRRAIEESYRIVESILASDVEKRVNDLMAGGWKPLGNLIALHYEEEGRECTKFIQAMVKGPSPH